MCLISLLYYKSICTYLILEQPEQNCPSSRIFFINSIYSFVSPTIKSFYANLIKKRNKEKYHLMICRHYHRSTYFFSFTTLHNMLAWLDALIEDSLVFKRPMCIWVLTKCPSTRVYFREWLYYLFVCSLTGHTVA